MTKYSVISMFSGCGGMDLGFTGGFKALNRFYPANPFEIVWANDMNKFACATYQHNLEHQIRVGDVWDHIDSMPHQVDLLIGGFPCQDISINGKRAGVAGARSGLYRAMVEAVQNTRPRIFVAENVKGLLFSYNKESLSQVLNDFSCIGYNVNYKLYFAPEYGVPQRRERVLIVGVRDSNHAFEHPEPVFSKDQFVNASMAISDLEDHPIDEDFSHVFSYAKKSSDQGGRTLDPFKPAATVRAECHGNNQFHYKLPRRISMREAARFQSFPDDFRFLAKLRETERMIGNAVPPVLAWHVAQRVRETLDRLDLGYQAFAAE